MPAGTAKLASAVHWCTPEWVLDIVRQSLGGIDLDPCSNVESTVAAANEWLWPEHDALKEDWGVVGRGTRVFVNPPFGASYRDPIEGDVLSAGQFKKVKETDPQAAKHFLRSDLVDWAAKAHAEVGTGAVGCVVAFLCPTNVETDAWQSYLLPAGGLCLLFDKRVPYLQNGKTQGTPQFGSALTLIGALTKQQHNAFLSIGSQHGVVVEEAAAL